MKTSEVSPATIALFRNVSTSKEAARVHTAEMAKVKKSHQKRLAASQEEVAACANKAERAQSTTKAMEFAGTGVGILSDGAMEAAFMKAKASTKVEAGVAAGVTVLSAGVAFVLPPVAAPLALGVTQAAGGRLARMAVRKFMG